jgi:protein required for attachment to host cells
MPQVLKFPVPTPVPVSTIRIVVANAGLARMFRATRPSHRLVELDSLSNGDARLHARDLVSDRSGRMSQQGRGAGDTYSPRQTLETQVAEAFARRVCTHLSEQQASGAMRRLYLLAEPRFLGLLRPHIKPGLREIIVLEQATDLTHGSMEQIRQALPERI